VNGRGPRYDGCMNESERARESHEAAAGAWRHGALPVDSFSRPGDAAHPRLGVKPLHGARQLPFTRGVTAPGSIGDDAASPTHSHPSVGLREMMLIEPSA
jgi:hypothetical protein